MSFAAGLGGIYSLFIGMSVITFFEVIYFSTFRLLEAYIRNGRESQEIGMYKKRVAQISKDFRVVAVGNRGAINKPIIIE